MKKWRQYFIQSAASLKAIEAILPYLWALGLVLCCVGLFGGLGLAPSDFQQGNGFRIIYIHVPSAILSLLIYLAMSIMAIIGLVYRIKTAYLALESGYVVGFFFTLMALITGSIWGKPMWGTYWIWDARLSSELILAFIYLALIGLNHAFEQHENRNFIMAIITLVAAVDIPIIHYSVAWFSTLHQGASLSLVGPSTIQSTMLWPLYVMIVGFFILALAMGLWRMSALIILRERHNKAIRQYVLGDAL